MTSGVELIAVVGPTGTGKSALALSLAETLGGEIVGCDAIQVYRGLDAGTAKPTAAERARVPHHLVDCFDPRHDCSLADWVRTADRAIEQIAGRGRLPIVVGGTGLYLRGLLRGVLPAPARDPELRRRLAEVVRRGGLHRLRSWLERLDPASARRIPAADVQRTIRALELGRSGGGVWSDRLLRDGTWAGTAERYRSLKLGLDLDRARLCKRLDRRVDSFFEAGLVREVVALLEAGVPREANAFKAIGYREVLRALAASRPGVPWTSLRDGTPECGDLAAVREEVKLSTRRYAKRQRTWFRREGGVIWIDASAGTEAAASRAIEAWERRTGRSTPRAGKAAAADGA